MLPPPSDPRWREVISATERPQFEFLAAKILLGRISIELSRDNSPATIDKGAQELRALLEKHEGLPAARRDIEMIFGGAR